MTAIFEPPRVTGPLLTDLYQLTMAYAYWKAGRHELPAVFDLFFREPPFHLPFAVAAGMGEVRAFLERFRFSEQEIAAVRRLLPDADPRFFDWLRSVNADAIEVRAIPEGSLVFPREPLISARGPLAACQLLETPLLNLANYPTLMATNAARFRHAAGPKAELLEFGLRRAQGPDGGMSASRYAYLGGFDATSNVLAALAYNLPCKGTHAHAFVQSFTGLHDLTSPNLQRADGATADFVSCVRQQQAMFKEPFANEGELAAFIAYAQAFPRAFLALVDTYNVLDSGVPNFIFVALALRDFGYQPIGIRLDSGDLAELSKAARKMMKYADLPGMKIVASNDITVQALWDLRERGHEINVFGIGTHLVTCLEQPALGCVYKLVELDGKPRIKLSADPGKATLPGRKALWRLRTTEGTLVGDYLALADEPPPTPGVWTRAYVLPLNDYLEFEMPADVRRLDTDLAADASCLTTARQRCLEEIESARKTFSFDRDVPNFCVAVSERLVALTKQLQQAERAGTPAS